jgi:hypothetical protein
MKKRSRSGERRIAILVLTIVGATLLGFGLIFGLLAAPSLKRDAEQVEGLTPSSLASLRDGQLGQDVLVEGEISERNRTQLDPFVAYVRKELEIDSEGDEEWVEVERMTPPLLLVLPDGLVQLENRDYDLRLTTTIERYGDTRYHGIEKETQVIAVGTLVSDDVPPRINAEFVAQGSREHYIATQRGSAQVFQGLGTILGAVGAVLLLLSLVMWFRQRQQRSHV